MGSMCENGWQWKFDDFWLIILILFLKCVSKMKGPRETRDAALLFLC